MLPRHVSLLLFTMLAGCVAAPPPKPAPPPVASPAAIDQRQRDLELRIEQGFRSGRITPDEHRLLRGQADEIRRDERRYMDDGKLSVDERRALSARLERLRRELERQLNDMDRR